MLKANIVKRSKAGSLFLGETPRGCKLCMEGLKLVLFVTGRCAKGCFYCPLSEGRRGKDVIFANEVEVKDDLDIVLEARATGAKGAGLTGGDPLLVAKRSIEFIKLLKKFYGGSFHIHLYTTGMFASRQVLKELKLAGLDEIRFHADRKWWKAIESAAKMGLEVGAEMPVVPERNFIDQLKDLIIYLSKIKASFINLNELEISPSNFISVKQRGLVVDEKSLSAIKGSREEALKLLYWVQNQGIDINVHYCPSRVKDVAQVKKRLRRRAARTAKCYEEVLSESGLLKYALITLSESRLNKKKVSEMLRVPPHMVKLTFDDESTKLFLPSDLVANAVNNLKGYFNIIDLRVIEAMPTPSRTIVAASSIDIR